MPTSWSPAPSAGDAAVDRRLCCAGRCRPIAMTRRRRRRAYDRDRDGFVMGEAPVRRLRNSSTPRRAGEIYAEVMPVTGDAIISPLRPKTATALRCMTAARTCKARRRCRHSTRGTSTMADTIEPAVERLAQCGIEDFDVVDQVVDRPFAGAAGAAEGSFDTRHPGQCRRRPSTSTTRSAKPRSTRPRSRAPAVDVALSTAGFRHQRCRFQPMVTPNAGHTCVFAIFALCRGWAIKQRVAKSQSSRRLTWVHRPAPAVPQTRACRQRSCLRSQIVVHI